MISLDRLDAATADLEPPFAVVDLDAFDHNADALVKRAAGVPLRVASKSIRCRAMVENALQRREFFGVMAYSLAEAVWLADLGVEDILVGYPTADRAALRDLAASEARAAAITLMVDSSDHLDLVDDAVGAARPDLRVCIDIDASLRVLGVHLGVRRSPLRTPADAVRLTADVAKRSGFRLTGVMFYEAQIAGLPDTSAAVRLVKTRSAAELATRRTRVVDAVRRIAPLDLVNGGGTGSLEVTTADPVVTEVTAGSGLFGPALFDRYRAFQPQPAALFALPVTRRPAARIATLFGGGYPASGPAGRSRLPVPTLPGGLRMLRSEGAGEVQTPVAGAAARDLRVGGRVWLRHAKSGELCERFDTLHLVRGDRVERSVPTYRGEGKAFG